MEQHRRRPRRGATARTLTATVLAAAVSGCSGAAATTPDRTAELLVQVTSVHEETGMTLLEGPVLDAEGGLFVVDVTAPAGEPKVFRVDTASREVAPVFTDETGAYTSAQFSPYDGDLYLTDIAGGGIVSLAITPEGGEPTAFFAEDVDGAPMQPDDLAFDEEGDLYVTDTTGHDAPVWEARGRVVRIDRDLEEATVLADGLPAPNGISFTEDYAGLWVSQYAANRVDHLALGEGGTEVAAAHTALHFDGGTTQVDSLAVDADGNVYQGFHGRPEVRVYAPTGEHLATVGVPADAAGGLDSATNVAIAPGTTDAYMTVSGADGGFVYTFDALGEGIRQSNGG
jgi:lactonase